MYGFSSSTDDCFLIGDEVRRQVAAIELHALHDDDFGVGRLAFLDRDDAVGGADLLHRLGQLLADFGVVVGGDGGDFGDFLVVLVVDLLGDACAALRRTASTAFWMPRVRAIGSAPAAMALGLRGRCASARTVAVVVPSPATSLVLLAASLTSWAPMFSYGSFSSISSATVTPSLVTVGHAPALVDDGIAAARAKGAADGSGQLADAGEQFLASFVSCKTVVWLP